MRSIRKIYKAVFEPIADLDTYRALPTNEIRELDPFLFLNHHGPQVYPPNNNGLPFGPHPHRGFETLTFIFSGDIVHQDTGGHKSIMEAGGIQWMTAGSGLLHSETSSESFKKNGGKVEVLQLWMNLPARQKMIPPQYTGLQRSEIPQINLDNEKVKVNLVSGEWAGQKGPIHSLTGLTMASIQMKAGGSFQHKVQTKNEILFYVVKGNLIVNNSTVSMRSLIQFEQNDTLLKVDAEDDALMLFGYGQPFNEPIVAHGPFVMNSHEEINQAIRDYQSGKMGVWPE